MALTPAINQNAASVNFNAITYGAEPAVLQQLTLSGGFTYRPMGSLVGTPKATPGSSFFLFDESDSTQVLYGITYDTWLDTSAFAASLSPISFTARTATTAGNEATITVGNIAGNNGLSPVLATSIVTNLNINTSLLTLGARVSGAGIPSNSTLLQVLSSSAVVISGNVTSPTFTGDTTSASTTVSAISVNTNTLVVGAPISGAGIPAGATIATIVSVSSITISIAATATATGVTLTSSSRSVSFTSYPVSAADALISVAIVQGNTTQWIQGALVGVNGNTDIVDYLAANPTLARSLNRYNGAVSIPVVTFTFMGGN